MIEINLDEIKELCYPGVYKRALEYFNTGRILQMACITEENRIRAMILGTRLYNVNLFFDDNLNLISYKCECEAFKKYDGPCKHIVAALIKAKRLEHKINKQFEQKTKHELGADIIDFFVTETEQSQSKDRKPVTLLPVINLYKSNNLFVPLLNLKIGIDRLYTIKEIKEFLIKRDKIDTMQFGKFFCYNPKMHYFNSKGIELLELMDEILSFQTNMDSWSLNKYNSPVISRGSSILMSDAYLKTFFQIWNNNKFEITIDKKVYTINSIIPNIKIDTTVEIVDKDIYMDFDIKEPLIPITKDLEYIFSDGNLYQNDRFHRESILPIAKLFLSNSQKRYRIDNSLSDNFTSLVLPKINSIGSVQLDPTFSSRIVEYPLSTEVYLDKKGKDYLVDIKFLYGDNVIYPFVQKKTNSEIIILRDMAKENEVLNFFDSKDYSRKDKFLKFNSDDVLYDFIYEKINFLKEIATIYYSEDFKKIKIRKKISKIGRINIQNNDLLEFEFEFGDIDYKEMTNILSSIEQKKKYYKLKDGTFLDLNSDDVYQVSDLLKSLDIKKKEIKNGKTTFNKYKALTINQLLEGNNKLISKSNSFNKLINDITKPSKKNYTVPKKLDLVMRDYQKFGFKWLKTLAQFGFGGILADDMGLGKTIQILSFLLSEKQIKGKVSSIIIVPSSLMYNWTVEVSKFTPKLTCKIISGKPELRTCLINETKDYDMLITSYPLLRRDIDLYKERQFDYCIIDEAQHIKNPFSQNAKSVKLINAVTRFALTGTPIENNLTELWSIFDFVMPGFLDSHMKFRKDFEKPIIKYNDKGVNNKLIKMINPFIVRRLKGDVLNELPEKIENVAMSNMEEEQKKLYVSYLLKAKNQIDQEIKDKGFENSTIKILAALTRLRQICCHPSLFINNYKGKCAKMEQLFEIIDEAIEGNHRILLFSQFTGMLDIIEKEIKAKGIEYLRLDGSTPVDIRSSMVDQFNNGEAGIFLISLKAGGTGLNLTGADMVIHYDPWWNPAVENQATDRAYRIGQKKIVQVIKLISKGTIEEKIYNLQLKKKKLIDSVIKPGETLVSSLTKEEIQDIFIQ